MSNEDQTVDINNDNEAQQSSDAPRLELQDIQNLLACVDHAANEGAFKTWATIVQVLEVRNKVATFLEAVLPKAENTEEKKETDLNTELESAMQRVNELKDQINGQGDD